MFVKVLIMSESSPLIERHQLKGIEDRLGRVENTLSEILENGELMGGAMLSRGLTAAISLRAWQKLN